MSHRLLLQPEHEDDGLRYREAGFDVRAAPARTRWRLSVSRDSILLAVDTLNPSDSGARRRLIKSLHGADGPDAEIVVEAILRGLAMRLTDDWKEHQAWLSERAAARSEHSAGIDAEARALEVEARFRVLTSTTATQLEDPALLFRIGRAIAAQGVVREERNALLIYLAITSRLTSFPLSLFVKGESSSGKSHLVASVFRLFPPDAHIDLTSVSEKGLIYDQRSYAHVTIVFYEVHGQGNEFVNYLVRTLISEGQIRHLTTEKDETGRLVSAEIVKQGPTNFITTTTAPEGHAENETRVWSLLVDESADATRAVLNLNARQAAGDFQPAPVDEWLDVQEWLALNGPCEVVIPFAESLAELIPTEPVRMRRDFKRLLHLLSVCAVLHQRQRRRSESAQVVAELADYGWCTSWRTGRSGGCCAG